MNRLCLWIIALIFPMPLLAQVGALQGFCNNGGQQATTQGLKSTNYQQQVINSCTITVYLTGTTNKATIYSDKNLTPLGNPFTADAAGAVAPGHYLIFTALNQGVDIVASGGISPNTYPAPVTLCTDCFATNSINPQTIQVAATSPILVNNGAGPVGSGTATVSCPSCGTGAISPSSTPPVAGQNIFVYPNSVTTVCTTAVADTKSGSVSMTNGNCAGSPGISSATWGFSVDANNNIVTPSGATIPIANVTAIYPVIVSGGGYVQSGGSGGNSFQLQCKTTTDGVVVNYQNNGFLSGISPITAGQFISNASITVSAANYNSMQCFIQAAELEGFIAPPNVVSGSATVVGAYVYYTGTAITAPSLFYAQYPLNFTSYNSTLALADGFGVAPVMDTGTVANTYIGANNGVKNLVVGQIIPFWTAHTNTGASTFNFNNLGAFNIVKENGAPLTGGEMVVATEDFLVYQPNATWMLINPQTTAATIASGTATMGTGAITAGTCATVVTVAATNVATTDTITHAFNAVPGTGWPSLTLQAYPTAGDVNFLVCNPSAGSITPAAATLNWRVVR